MSANNKKLQLRTPGLRLLAACALAVAVLGLWHGLDVRDGIARTGNRFLYGWYGAAFVWGLGLLAASGWLLLIRRPWSLERVFVVCSLALGVLFAAVLPPLSAPDEVAHYISAYQVSNRLMGKTAADEDGRVLIRAQDAWVEDLEDVLADDGSGRTSDRDSAVLGQMMTQYTYGEIRGGGPGGGEAAAAPDGGMAEVAGGGAAVAAPGGGMAEAVGGGEAEAAPGGGKSAAVSGDGVAVSYQPAVHTTPLAYAPQAVGITLARALGLGSIGLLFLGRLFNLLFYTGMGYLTMRRMPFGKEVVFGVGLLPMTLNLVSSMSYDVMILAMTAYFTAVCLDLAYRAERVRLLDVAVLALVMAVMGPCKMVYGVIAGLCLLIPVKKFGGWGRWLAAAAAVLGAFALAMLVVNSQTVALYTGIQDRHVIWADEPGYSFAQLVHSPLLVLKMCYSTLVWQGGELFSGMIGGSLGNMDPVLNTPYIIVLGLAFTLLMLALRKPGESLKISGGQRVWIWVICLICLGALMFSMLLAWTPVSASFIRGVQGRYLLPLLPIFAISLKNDQLVRTDCDDRKLLFGMICMDVYVILRIFSVVCLRV